MIRTQAGGRSANKTDKTNEGKILFFFVLFVLFADPFHK